MYRIKVIVQMQDGELKQNGFDHWHDVTAWIDDLAECDVLPSVVTMTMETKLVCGECKYRPTCRAAIGNGKCPDMR